MSSAPERRDLWLRSLPTSLTAEALSRHIEMPLEWRAQKTALNIQ
jgi:hypothetical protein